LPMKFVDTNIFIRYFTGDDPAKQLNTKALFQRVIQDMEEIMTSEGVIHEICAVLSSPRLYNYTHQDIRDRLYPILDLPGVHITDKAVCLEALNIYGNNQTIRDYVDTVAIARVQNGECDGVYSYDRDLSKVPDTNRIEP